MPVMTKPFRTTWVLLMPNRFLGLLMILQSFLTCIRPTFTRLWTASLLTIFGDALLPIQLTQKVPVDNVIQFLDIKLTLSKQHVCWTYKPRASKPLLPYNSSHPKLVKSGIADLCFMNTLPRSCHHVIHLSLLGQSERLLSAGFPKAVLVSVAEWVLKRKRAKVE